MLKIGLIGAGYMGGMHTACYQALMEEDVKVTAVADLRPEYAKAAAEKFSAQIYQEGMDLIEQADVDVIDICLPTYLHTKYAVAAMKKGRAVFIEKPVCLSPDEMELLLAAQRETGVPVMVGQCIRLWSEYAWLKEAVENKTYGALRSGVFKRISPLPGWAWENWLHRPECSGTVAMDMHVHDVDYVRYLLGDPLEVTARAARDSEGVIQQIFATYGYEDAAVTVEACWDYPDAFPFTMEYRVKFDEATVVFDSSATPSLAVYPKTGGRIIPELDKEFESENDIGGNISSLGGYYNELRYFTQGVKNHTPLTVATLEEAVRSVRLVLQEIELAGGMRRP
ncbi:Gfo/Idh/MocA family oxidoreductase [Lachnospiraceae bacterium ASD3451]|uniref:Gfo/Idh/MocA family protein n=1 Tax=Diplocloster agilis TaxID=2850323 RepID=UPI001DEE988F|nr:Gfo/Idh/MocA family oxidoreductase [Diplocloster agilis]MBU9746201.1 Gfo/Idh/MocA family oxidoreductase [Diplocloster agilis]